MSLFERILVPLDEVVFLHVPDVLFSVDFSQVSDEEVVDILKGSRRARMSPSSSKPE